MAIKYVVVKGCNPQSPELTRYAGKSVQVDHPSLLRLARMISDQCSLTISDVLLIVSNMMFVVQQMMLHSFIVRLGDFGSMRAVIKSGLGKNADEWSVSMVRGIGFVFTPGMQLNKLYLGAEYKSGGKVKMAEPEEEIPA